MGPVSAEIIQKKPELSYTFTIRLIYSSCKYSLQILPLNYIDYGGRVEPATSNDSHLINIEVHPKL